MYRSSVGFLPRPQELDYVWVLDGAEETTFLPKFFQWDILGTGTVHLKEGGVDNLSSTQQLVTSRFAHGSVRPRAQRLVFQELYVFKTERINVGCHPLPLCTTP